MKEALSIASEQKRVKQPKAKFKNLRTRQIRGARMQKKITKEERTEKREEQCRGTKEGNEELEMGT
jgi:hypothetical protein